MLLRFGAGHLFPERAKGGIFPRAVKGGWALAATGTAQLSPLSERAFDFLRHPHDGEHFSVAQGDLQIFQGGVAFGAVKGDAA